MYPLLISVLMLFSGCGYRPAVHYSKHIINEDVSTEIIISLTDPENTVIIKDAIDAAVITRFRANLVPKGKSNTHLIIRLMSVSLSPLAYDANGDVISYRTMVLLSIERVKKEVRQTYRARGTFDFAIEPNAIVSNQARFNAIKQSANKAIESFLAQVAAQGSQDDDQ